MREPNIYTDLSNADYHADRTAIGNSGLKAMRRSPAYYFGQYLDPGKPPKKETETAAQKFGNMAHCILFEEHAFNARYRIGPEVANKNLKAWQDFKKDCEADGATAIDQQEYDTAHAIRNQALSVPDIRTALLGAGFGEASVYAADPVTGVRVKVRPDKMYCPFGTPDKGVILLDGKTFDTTDEEAFGRQAANMDYDMQAAFYSDAVGWQTKAPVLGFIFIVIENEYPFLTAQIQLDEESMANGKRKYRRALDSYAKCVSTGIWPGPGHELKMASIPHYKMEL